MLKLPTVCVMPSWMAPFKADDVVWRGRENESDTGEQQTGNRNERS